MEHWKNEKITYKAYDDDTVCRITVEVSYHGSAPLVQKSSNIKKDLKKSILKSFGKNIDNPENIIIKTEDLKIYPFDLFQE